MNIFSSNGNMEKKYNENAFPRFLCVFPVAVFLFAQFSIHLKIL